MRHLAAIVIFLAASLGVHVQRCNADAYIPESPCANAAVGSVCIGYQGRSICR